MRLAPLSKYLRDYHGKNRPYKSNIIIARIHPEVDGARLNHVVSFGMDELTKPYDNFEIMRIGIHILFHISRRTCDRKYICSELVYECFNNIGIPFRLPDEYVSPDNICQDRQMQMQMKMQYRII